jgi:hypothetical protein
MALWVARARGEPAGPESDVDLLVITAAGSADLRAATRLLHRIADEERADPTAFSVLAVDPAWLEGRRAIRSFFMQEVDRDKVVLQGPRESPV